MKQIIPLSSLKTTWAMSHEACSVQILSILFEKSLLITIVECSAQSLTAASVNKHMEHSHIHYQLFKDCKKRLRLLKGGENMAQISRKTILFDLSFTNITKEFKFLRKVHKKY